MTRRKVDTAREGFPILTFFKRDGKVSVAITGVETQELAQTSPTVLLVEDNPITNKLYSNTLKSLNCRVFSSTTVRSALRYCHFLSPQRFDLIVLDLELPDGQGFSVSRAVRAYEAVHGGHVPILMLTSLVEMAQADSAKEGCDAVFGKLSMKEFSSLIDKWLKWAAENKINRHR